MQIWWLCEWTNPSRWVMRIWIPMNRKMMIQMMTRCGSMWFDVDTRLWMSTHLQNWFRIIVCRNFRLEFISIFHHSSGRRCLHGSKFCTLIYLIHVFGHLIHATGFWCRTRPLVKHIYVHEVETEAQKRRRKKNRIFPLRWILNEWML